MKKLIFGAILFSIFNVAGQDLSFDKDFFKNKLTNLKINQPNFSNFKTFQSFKKNQIEEQSVLLLRPSEFANPYNQLQPIGYRMKKIPYSINYEQDFTQCGSLQLRNSEDMMFGAVIDYVFNKYVVGLFLATPYDD